MSSWPRFTVEELISKGIIERPMDGNHGSIHPKSTDYVDDGIPFVMASDLANGRVNTRECAFISEKLANTLRKGFARTGDVLLSHKATIGRVAVVRQSAYPFVMLTPQVTYYRVADDNALNNFFLYYYFQSRDFLDVLEQWAGAGSTRAYLGITGQKKLPIALPPIRTQNEIAAILGALDDKIELNRKTAATLEEMARALYRSWFVDFDPVRARAEGRAPAHMDAATAALFPDSFGEDGLPEGWGEVRLGALCSIKGGKQLTKEQFSNGGRYPVFGGAGYMGRSNESNADGFVITVGRVGAYCGKFVAHRGRCWVNNNASQISPFPEIASEILFLLLKELDLSAIRKGAAQPFISNGDLAEMKTVIASKPILGSFCELIIPLQMQQECLKQENQTLETLRDTLLPRLMSGELRVGAARELIEDVA
ncbi:restriction endonuclease subunit S [Luteibacter anthropi]|uniref:restriction endonuclease subunit S n=1 Tax=Luteibacter anthropi TaxID=564369 RepID=UPI0020322B62|nr:restriction endonuclease subunit S [Luteibacter anthropi]URX61888.1 restriction endonuclease subunit S [Luteibacter anthropi]